MKIEYGFLYEGTGILTGVFYKYNIDLLRLRILHRLESDFYRNVRDKIIGDAILAEINFNN